MKNNEMPISKIFFAIIGALFMIFLSVVLLYFLYIIIKNL